MSLENTPEEPMSSKQPVEGETSQSRPTRKRVKSERGVPEIYTEKKDRVSVSLTKTAAQLLNDLSSDFQLSRSEFIEQIARGYFKIIPPKD